MKELSSKSLKKVLQFVDKFATIIKKEKGDFTMTYEQAKKLLEQNKFVVPY